MAAEKPAIARERWRRARGVGQTPVPILVMVPHMAVCGFVAFPVYPFSWACVHQAAAAQLPNRRRNITKKIGRICTRRLGG